MMTQTSPTGAAPNGWLMPLIIAVCSAGAGVTGTLLWTQSRPTLVVAPSQNAATPISIAPTAAMKLPPMLTAGMTPAQAALTRGNWHYDHGQWQQAISQYEDAIAKGLDNPNVRTDLGNCYRFAGQPKRALEEYRRAQKQNPRHEQSLFNQGGVYASSLNDSAKAVAVWREYLKRFPQGESVKQARQLIAVAQKNTQYQTGDKP